MYGDALGDAAADPGLERDLAARDALADPFYTGADDHLYRLPIGWAWSSDAADCEPLQPDEEAF